MGGQKEIQQEGSYEEQALLAGVWLAGRRKVSSVSFGQTTDPLFAGNASSPARTPSASHLRNCSWEPLTKEGSQPMPSRGTIDLWLLSCR